MTRSLARLRPVLIAAATIVGVYLLVCLLVWWRQDDLVFFPGAPPATTPRAAGLAFEEHEIATEDGERLHAWTVGGARPGDARALILHSHGNAGSIEHRIDAAAAFVELGFAVLLYDYRGYGRSSGTPSEAGLYRDARAAWRHATEVLGWPPGRIVLFGESLGGAVAIELACRADPAAVVVEETFSSLPDVGARVYPWLPVRLLARTRMASAAKLAGLRAPLLVIHSPDDEIVPFELGRRLFEAAREPKAFLATGGRHAQGGFRLREQWVGEVRAFLGRALEPRPH
jgi:fermentation-respiration switch protein FrsA (DUF1100 family)